MENLKKTGLIILTFIFLSCDSWLGISITDEADIKKFHKEMIKLLGDKNLINEVVLLSADRSLNIMGTALVTYSPSENSEQKNITIDLSTWKILKEETIKTKNDYQKPTSINDYDFSKIPDICQQAINKTDSLGLEYAGIEQFIIRTSDNNTQAFEFILDGRLKNSPITSKGRYSGIYYHKVYFTIDKNDEWKIKVDEKINTKRGGF